MDPSRVLIPDELVSEVRALIPPMDAAKYKGQAGKVAVIGGCREYTGAPYFAAYSALLVGADLVHVFCTGDAATVIKSYSPELIVHPYLRCSQEVSADSDFANLVEECASEVEAWFSRLDVIVLGPGLGRDPLLLDIAAEVIRRAAPTSLQIVLDADALFLVARQPELVAGCDNVLLTPNLNEYRRLAAALGVSLQGQNNDRSSKLLEVTRVLAGPIIVSKGPADAICDGDSVVSCTITGSPRRCGGQGDVLSGTIAVFVAWSAAHFRTRPAATSSAHPLVLAGYGGCMVVRRAARLAFAAKKRSMVAGDVIQSLGPTVDMVFDSVTDKENALYQQE